MRDLDIRNAIQSEFEVKYEQDARILHELGINRGSARIDIAVLNGSINGFEIKSEKDTLTRLPDQASLYNSVFDFLTIVLNENHADEAMEIIPNWWGITLARYNKEKVVFEKIREPEKNPSQDKRILVELLWKKEAYNFLNQHNLGEGMKSKKRQELWDKICEKLPLDTIKQYVINTLKQRKNWRSS